MSKARGGGARFRCVNSRAATMSARTTVRWRKRLSRRCARGWMGTGSRLIRQGLPGNLQRVRANRKGKAGAGPLTAQLDTAFNLVEQGVYTLDVFRTRREELETALEGSHQRCARLRSAERDGRKAAAHSQPDSPDGSAFGQLRQDDGAGAQRFVENGFIQN